MDLSALHLEGANLRKAHLERASLHLAHLERAVLRAAHLEGKTYAPGDAALARIRQADQGYNFPATLPPADLHLAFFDAATTLDGISLGDAKGGAVQVADVRWGGVNLAVVDWTPFTDRKAVLRDEQAAREYKAESFTETEEQHKRPRRERAQARAKHSARQAQQHLQLSRAAVRANWRRRSATRG